MTPLINPHFLALVENFSYLGVLAYFWFLGHFIPVPEEVVFLFLGYLSAEHSLAFWPTLITIVGGIFLADNFLFFFSQSQVFSRLRSRIDHQLVSRYTKAMSQHLFKTMLGLRLIPGLRFLGALIAGSTKIAWGRFFIYDFIIVSIYSSVFFLLGYHSHFALYRLIGGVKRFRLVVFILLLLIIAGLAIYRWYQRPPTAASTLPLLDD
jgi:membrane protein DedA with SNARE-associated domain